ncbi:hypothetical protein [Pseudomonas sp.]|jgi:adenylate kinase family enzyme|uniref:hypothetical protein n=1 Tax=Pseudomonas sp. TaxID=306 RepID=UPI0028AB970D|nr:hypothetical protein [Pseudomonas sp.]
MDAPRRINVVGTSGSGKSTFARRLAHQLDLPYVEMDALFWRPDWQESDDQSFFARLQRALAQPGWVLDGNYNRTTAMKWQRVEMIVWIDYSFIRTLYQAISRALRRSFSGEELWPGTGNRESFRRSFLSRNSILLWTLKNFRSNRRRYAEAFADPRLAHIQRVRLRSPAAVETFLLALH